MNAEKSLILVLGMHRSGTSVLTRVLNLLGADLGSGLLTAQEGVNARGFWENAAVVAINEELLALLGRSWYDIRPLPDQWWLMSRLDAVRKKAGEFLQVAFGEASMAAIKDPRLCLLLPFWLECARVTGWTPRVVLATRAPWEVVGSLCKRDPLDSVTAHLMWLRYTRDAEVHSRGLLRGTVDYAELLGDWRKVMQRIASELGISWPVAQDDAAEVVAGDIDPGLRHQKSRFRGTDMVLANLAGKVYHLLLGGALDERALDERWRELDELLISCQAFTTGLVETNQRLMNVNNRLQQMGGMHQQALETVAEKDRQLAAMAGELEYARSVVEERDAQLKQLVSDLDEREAQIHQLLTIIRHPAVKVMRKLFSLGPK